MRKAHGDDDEPDLRPDDADEQKGKDELREGEENVDRPHDESVDATTEVGGRDTCGSPDEDPERGRRECHQEQLPASGENPREHVAAQHGRSPAGTGRTAARRERSRSGQASTERRTGLMAARSTTEPPSDRPRAPRRVRTAAARRWTHWRRTRGVTTA